MWFTPMGTRQYYPLSPLLLRVVLGVLPSAVRQEKEMSHILGKEETLFTGDIFFYEENSKELTKKIPLEPIDEFNKVARYKANTQKLIVLSYTSDEQ